MRISFIIGGFALVVAALAAESRGGFVYATNVAVSAQGTTFTPATTAIAEGDTVTWTFADAAPHSVKADGGAFDSGAEQVGGTFAFSFNTAGSFAYYCIVHGAPGGLGMAGTITVQAPPTATATIVPPTATSTTAASATPTRTTTRTATLTPGTPTVTPIPTTTAIAPIVSATAIVVLPISATQSSGGAAPSLAAPSVGTGPSGSGDSTSHRLSVALAATGALMLAGAVLTRRRA